jgi:hypothetical protein
MVASPKSRIFMVSRGCDFDVARFEITMDYALFVCGVQRFDHLAGNSKDLLSCQRLSGESVSQRVAFDVLHDEIPRADIMQRTDARVIQRGYGPRFALEPIAKLSA